MQIDSYPIKHGTGIARRADVRRDQVAHVSIRTGVPHAIARVALEAENWDLADAIRAIRNERKGAN